MKITPKFTRLNSGENNSRILFISIDSAYEGMKAKLGFITPMGKLYMTDELILSNNTCEYSIPYILLDGKGMLLTQLIVYENEDYIIKSPIEEYPVFSSVDDMSAPTVSDESLKSLSLVFDILARKSDIGHIHDEIYYTENEINALLSLKSDTGHTHEGVYLTKEELERLLPEAQGSVFEHNHDSRYYTEKETDELLLLKQDKLPLTDYIVEEGSSGIWTYRKWASGIAECWGQKTIETAITKEWGSLFMASIDESGQSFPFAFKQVPLVFADIQSGEWLAIVAQGPPSATTTNLGGIRIIRSVITENPGRFKLNYTVRGRWK